MSNSGWMWLITMVKERQREKERAPPPPHSHYYQNLGEAEYMGGFVSVRALAVGHPASSVSMITPFQEIQRDLLHDVVRIQRCAHNAF